MKMKFKFFFSLLFIFFSLNSKSQNWEWAQAPYNTGSEGWRVRADDFGNIYAIGFFNNQFVFGTDTLSATQYGGDAFLIKYDRFGNYIWSRLITGSNNEYAWGLAIDLNGNAIVTGSSSSPILYAGEDSVTSNYLNYDHAFIIKYDSAGVVQWMNISHADLRERSSCVATDLEGNIYLSGSFESQIMYLGSDTIHHSSSTFNYDIFIGKISSDGTVLWLRGAGSPNYDSGEDICTDNFGNVYLTGCFGYPEINFDAITLSCPYNSQQNCDFFLLKFDSTGNAIWGKRAGKNNFDRGNGVVADRLGNVYVCGFFESSKIIFGNDTLQKAGGADGFFLRYNSSGNLIWVKQVTGSSADIANAVALDDECNVYFSGGTNSFGTNNTFDLIIDTLVLPFPYGGYDPEYIIEYNPTGEIICHQFLPTGGDDQGGICVNHFGQVYNVSDFYNVDTMILGSDTLVPNTSFGVGESYFIAAFTGCFSCNLDAHKSSIKASICKGETYQLTNGENVTSAGVYSDTISHGSFCDSLVVTYLTINSVDTSLTQTGVTLTANATTATYQWLDCNNGFAIINGATNQTFTVTANGNYAVAITQNGCNDTSACYSVAGVGVSELAVSNLQLAVFPNPALNQLTVYSSQLAGGTISITNILVREIYQSTNNLNSQIINLKSFSSGIYFLKVISADGNSAVKKFVKE